jgi:hypothetical protein
VGVLKLKCVRHLLSKLPNRAVSPDRTSPSIGEP